MSKRPSLKALERHSLPTPTVDDAARTSTVAAGGKQQPSRVGKKVVTVYLSESVWREVKVLAAKTDSTIDALMRRGLDHVFAEHKINRGAADS
ncbi:MAG: hypothetical protein P4M13_10680 [Alphaproteobacteria bacterium]|nr:hypothetical protein [Alphaproteobacteria bacterium]